MRRQAVPLLVLPRLRDALLSAGSATLEGPLRLHSHTRLLRLPLAAPQLSAMGLSSSCRPNWLPSMQVSRQSPNRAKAEAARPPEV